MAEDRPSVPLVPASHDDLVANAQAVTLVTLMPDGQPQASVVWCMYDSQNILINMAAGTQKVRNLKRNPRATILAVDPKNEFHYVEVRGRVTRLTAEGAAEHMDDLSAHYTGKRPYYGEVMPLSAKTRRMLADIEPTRILTFDMEWPPKLEV